MTTPRSQDEASDQDEDAQEAHAAYINTMREWFYAQYERPVDCLPYEGGFIYINGGPYEAREVLFEEFGDRVPQAIIQALINELDEESAEWSPIPDEWEEFTIHDNECSSFHEYEFINHVSHIDSAINIIKSGEIQPSHIYQKISASWLSPNHWAKGYRYGNVCFRFSFRDIIRGMNFYKFGIRSNKILGKNPTCQILITNKNYDVLNPRLRRYNPTQKNGPWWFDQENDRHYITGKCSVDFMVEDPISLHRLKTLDFVKHHDSQCSMDDQDLCLELGLDPGTGKERFLTRAVLQKVDLLALSNRFNVNFFGAFLGFIQTVSREQDINFYGSLTESSEESIDVMREIMAAHTFGNVEEAREHCGMFQDRANFIRLAAKVVTNAGCPISDSAVERILS